MRPTTGFSVFVPCGMCRFDISTVTPSTTLQWPCYCALTPTSILENTVSVGQITG